MTKAGGLALWAGGDHIADLDFSLGHNDPRHQALNQLPPLLPRGLIQPRPYAPAERLRAQANTGEFGLAVYLRFQLAQLSFKRLPFLVQSVAPAPELVETHNTRQVGLGEPLDLLLNTGLPAPQRRPTRLQILRQPMPAMRPLQGKADGLRLVQQPAQILPDQRVHLLGWNVAGGARCLPVSVNSRELAATAVVAVA